MSRSDSPAKKDLPTLSTKRKDSLGSIKAPLSPAPNTPITENNEDDTFSATFSPDDKNLKEAIQKMKQFIDEEWEREGFAAQTRRDGEIWYNTLRFPGLESRGMMLRRLFCVLRFGGFFYRSKNIYHKKKDKASGNKVENGKIPSPEKVDPETQWRPWYKSGWPIATALSHGGRFVIQLPKSKSTDPQKSKDLPPDYSFWNWLITGNPNGDVSQYISTAKSGDQCQAEGKLLFKRLGATHSLSLVPQEGDSEYLTLQKDQTTLGFNRKKVLMEEKTSGFSLRDTKIIGSGEYVLKHHRHWGANIPLGGEGFKRPLTGQIVMSNGCHGHLYFYLMPPKKGKFGGLLVGLEGSEWGKYSAVGDYHGVSAKSSPYSPSFGYKWKAHKHVDLSSVKGPDKYDSMYVDLTDGWEFLIDAVKTWRDDWVKETSLPIKEDPKWKDLEENRARIISKSHLGIDRLTTWDRTVEFRRAHFLSKTNFRKLITLKNT